MGRRTIAILIFLLGIVMIAILVVVVVLPTLTPEPVAPTTTEEGISPEVVQVEPTVPPTVGVFVSLQTVPRGFQYPLTVAELEGLIIQDQRVAGEVNDNVITNVEDILGLYARNDVFQGETLTKDALAKDPTQIGIENYGPSSLIPPGSIAAAIPMDRLSSVAYALDEGDHIDIMMTFYFYQIDEEFQTFLQNAGVFFLEESVQTAVGDTGSGGGGDGEAVETAPGVFIISPYGRFEQLPTGDLAHISPSEFQRPIPISMILQNAKVIQVGPWEPPELAQPPTPIPTPVEGAEATATPVAQVTPIPEPPDVLVVALTPQQQLLVKYGVESFADIDFALRGANDGQIYTIENIDLEFMLQRFGIEVPENFGFSVDIPAPTQIEATPEASSGQTSSPPEGG